MNSPVSQLHACYIDLRNCEANSGPTAHMWLLLAVSFIMKTFPLPVNTRIVFLFPSVKGGLVTESGDSLLEVETAEPSFLIGKNYERN